MSVFWVEPEISFALFLFLQVPLLLSAWAVLPWFGPAKTFEKLAVIGFVYVFQAVVFSLILGFCGLLTLPAAAVLSWGAAAVALASKQKFHPKNGFHGKLDFAGKIAVSIVFGFVLFNIYLNLQLPPFGTDSLLYHLFYPACWIQEGRIFRIHSPGMFTEYYPFYGELLYCWWMLPVGAEYYAKVLQYALLVPIFFTLAAGGIALGSRTRESLLGAAAAVLTGIVFRNATVANTDTITGYFMLCGVVFFIRATGRRGALWVVLSGAAFALGASTKYSGILLAATYGLLLVGAALWMRRFSWRKLLAFGLSGVIFGAPCFVWNWITTGNPVFPIPVRLGKALLFNGIVDLKKYPSSGFSLQTWDFYVTGDSQSLAAATIFLFVAVALIALFFAFSRWSRRGGNACSRHRPLLVCVTVLSGIAAIIMFYPAYGQPRQIIPALLPAGILFAYVFALFHRWRWCQIVILFVMIALNSYRQVLPHTIPYILLCGAAIFTLLFFWQKPGGKWRVSAILVILLLVNFVVVGNLRNCEGLWFQAYRQIISPEISAAWHTVERLTETEPANIAVVYGGCYALLGRGIKNRAIYVPVTASGKDFPHDYPSLAATRAPGAYQAWKQRLSQRKAKFLFYYKFLPKELNPLLEYNWAIQHPQDFKLLFRGREIAIFEFAGTGK